jgi:hypothetical protein
MMTDRNKAGATEESVAAWRGVADAYALLLRAEEGATTPDLPKIASLKRSLRAAELRVAKAAAQAEEIHRK